MNNILILVIQLCSVIGITVFAARFSLKPEEKAPKGVLIAWICIQALFANLFVLEPIDLFGFSCSPSDAFAVGSMISLSLLQQQEGQKQASFASLLSIITLGVFALFSAIHLLFTPYEAAPIYSSYKAIFSHSPRLLLASMGAFFLSQRVDLKLFSWITTLFPKAPFLYKVIPSAFISQTLDTALFTLFGLYGLVDGLFSIFLISSFAKWVTAIFLSSLTALLVNKKPPRTI